MRRRAPALVRALAIGSAALVAAACQGSWPASATSSEAAPAPPGAAADPAPPVPPTRVEVLARHPHDPQAFTQGLVLVGDRLFESTGRFGQSSLREVDVTSGRSVQRVALAPELFGEGLAVVGDRLVQLTWTNGVALLWSVDGLEPRGRFAYEGEGWGLCLGADGRLVHSDGSDMLTFRDPATFGVLGRVAVTRAGAPLTQLNELECAPDGVWANVWQTDEIVRIDPASGLVTATVVAAGLGPSDADPANVLNGIARRPDGTWLLTGKNWPTLYEVRFVP